MSLNDTVIVWVGPCACALSGRAIPRVSAPKARLTSRACVPLRGLIKGRYGCDLVPAMQRGRGGVDRGGLPHPPFSYIMEVVGTLVLPLLIFGGKALDDDVTTLAFVEELPEEGG